jgi:hypothetical protein
VSAAVSDQRGRRVIAVGVAGASAAIVRDLVEAGAEVHSVAPARPDVAWLASHTDVDLADPGALVDAVVRIGAVVHAVHVCAPLDAVPRAALLAAAQGRALDGCCEVFDHNP